MFRKWRAIGRMLASFSPRRTTMLIFTGASPAASAASIPASTRATGNSTSFMHLNTVSSSESRLTVTRFSPAAASAGACSASSEPFVVSVRSMSGICASIPTSTSRPRRMSGSPPVRRIFFVPRLAKTAASLASSSKVRSCSFGRNW